MFSSSWCLLSLWTLCKRQFPRAHVSIFWCKQQGKSPSQLDQWKHEGRWQQSLIIFAPPPQAAWKEHKLRWGLVFIPSWYLKQCKQKTQFRTSRKLGAKMWFYVTTYQIWNQRSLISGTFVLHVRPHINSNFLAIVIYARCWHKLASAIFLSTFLV